MSSSNTSRKQHTHSSTRFSESWQNTATRQRSGAEALPAYYANRKKDPHNIAIYRPIALMNGKLKLWTSILTNIGSPWAEAQGILSDTANGFRRHIKIYDSLSTHIMIYEDANMLKKSHIQGLLRFQRHLRGHGSQSSLQNNEIPRIPGTQSWTPHQNIRMGGHQSGCTHITPTPTQANA